MPLTEFELKEVFDVVGDGVPVECTINIEDIDLHDACFEGLNQLGKSNLHDFYHNPRDTMYIDKTDPNCSLGLVIRVNDLRHGCTDTTTWLPARWVTLKGNTPKKTNKIIDVGGF